MNTAGSSFGMFPNYSIRLLFSRVQCPLLNRSARAYTAIGRIANVTKYRGNRVIETLHLKTRNVGERANGTK